MLNQNWQSKMSSLLYSFFLCKLLRTKNISWRSMLDIEDDISVPGFLLSDKEMISVLLTETFSMYSWISSIIPSRDSTRVVNWNIPELCQWHVCVVACQEFVYLKDEENTQKQQNQDWEKENAGGHVGIEKGIAILIGRINLNENV